MSTTYAGRIRNQRAANKERIAPFRDELHADLKHAFGPARALLDSSEARPLALELRSVFESIPALYDEIESKRDELERASHVKVVERRNTWQGFLSDFEFRVNKAYSDMKRQIPQVRSALEREALPLTTDSAATLVARQDVEAVYRVHGSDLRGLIALAQRGGDVAAALVSDWGRLQYAAAGGVEESFSAVMSEAIKTSLNSPHEGPKRAARTLEAFDTPRPGGKVPSLYDAEVLAVHIIGDVRAVQKSGAILE